MRQTEEVLRGHLQKRKDGKVDADIATNYSREAIILSGSGEYRGHQGAKQSADLLSKELGESRFFYKQLLVRGNFGFLEWSAEGEKATIGDGADSFFVQNGVIIFQSIHYTTQPK